MNKVRSCCNASGARRKKLVADGDFDVDAGVDGHLGDLSDLLGGGDEVDHSLVDSHLEAIPGLGTFTIGRLSGGDSKSLGGLSDWALENLIMKSGQSE